MEMTLNFIKTSPLPVTVCLYNNNRYPTLTIYWTMENNLRFNASKCKVLTITRKKNPIMHPWLHSWEPKALIRVDSEKDLGITTSSKLSWDFHVNTMHSCKGQQNVRRSSKNVHTIDNSHYRLIFHLGKKKYIPGKSILKWVKLQSLVAKCCKMQKI